MRKTIFGVANSVDNFIAREDGAMDWVRMSDEVFAMMKSMFESIDTIVMGRKTYEATVAMGSPLSFGVPILVSTRRSMTLSDSRVTVVERDAVELIAEMREAVGRDICIMAGGRLAGPLLEAQLIDELHLTVHPLLLGSGAPLFPPMKRQVDLELLECKSLPGGCVALGYRVLHRH